MWSICMRGEGRFGTGEVSPAVGTMCSGVWTLFSPLGGGDVEWVEYAESVCMDESSPDKLLRVLESEAVPKTGGLDVLMPCGAYGVGRSASWRVVDDRLG